MFYKLLSDANTNFYKMALAIQTCEDAKALLATDHEKLKTSCKEIDAALTHYIKKSTDLEDAIAKMKKTQPSTSADCVIRPTMTSSGNTETGSSLMGIGQALHNMDTNDNPASSIKSGPPKKKYKKTEVYLYPENNRESDNKQRKAVVSRDYKYYFT